MDIERAVISAAVSGKSVGEAVDEGITVELFSEVAAPMWTWMTAHFSEFGESPGLHAFKQAWPDYEVIQTTEGVLYYGAMLRKHFAAVYAHNKMKEAALVIRDGGDPYAAIDLLRDAVLKTDDVRGGLRDIDWVKTQRQRLAVYEEARLNPDGIDGYPYPFATINHATKGKHRGELILVAADQGVGKSWFLTLCAKLDWDNQVSPILFSKEMPAWQFGRRLDALEYSLPYRELRDGLLNTDTYVQWIAGIEVAEGAEDSVPFPIIDDEAGGVSHIAAKAIKYRSAVIYIDGGYLMDDDRKAKSGWEAFGNITRDLKRLAKRLDVPIVVTVQLNGDDVAYFKGVKRDADVIIKLSRDSDQEMLQIMQVEILKLREGAKLPRPLEVLWDIDRMKFEELRARPTSIEMLEDTIVKY